jgi:5-methylcytosine-specific restriction endonuclease McrA
MSEPKKHKHDFSEETRIKVLLWSYRHCCLCGKQCGTKIEVHHIVPKSRGGTSDIDNAIALCFDCHSEVGAYQAAHPKGTKFSEKELKAREIKSSKNTLGIWCLQ